MQSSRNEHNPFCQLLIDTGLYLINNKANKIKIKEAKIVAQCNIQLRVNQRHNQKLEKQNPHGNILPKLAKTNTNIKTHLK